jgi:endonuclease/exonuclease/phosphatase (EEP) superfamily protein YafD
VQVLECAFRPIGGQPDNVFRMKLRWLLLSVLLALLLVPAGLVTVARLLDLPGGPWVRLVAFTPYAGLLYAVALLPLLLVALRGRGFRRGGARFLGVVAVLGLLVHAYWAGGPFLGTSAAEASGGRRLNVMTSNLLLGHADAAQVVEVAVDRDVDVLVVEEVTPEALSRLRAAGIGRVLDHSAGRAEPGIAGTMVFADRPLRNVRRLDTAFGSYAMDLRLRGGPVHLLAVHPRPPIGDVAEWRADQRAIRQAARGQQGQTLLVGDFNATMDHVPLRELVGRGYDDAATEATSGWQPTWPSAGQVSRFGIPVPPLLPIDHVFLGAGLRALRTESVTVDGTDHRALVASLAL